LYEENKGLHEQLDNHLKTIESQEEKFTMFNEEIVNLKVLLDAKTNTSSSKIILVVAMIAIVSSVVSYFF